MASIRLLRQAEKDAVNKNEKAYRAYLNEYDANYRPAFDNYKGQVDSYNEKVKSYNAIMNRQMYLGNLYEGVDGKIYEFHPYKKLEFTDQKQIAREAAHGNIIAYGKSPGVAPTAPKAPNDPLIIDPKFTSAEQRKLREDGGLTMAQQQQLINKGYQPKSDLAGDDAPTRNSAFYNKEDALKDVGILTRTLAGQFGKF